MCYLLQSLSDLVCEAAHGYKLIMVGCLKVAHNMLVNFNECDL